MKLKDALKLKNGQKVMHRRYGECDVQEVVMSFGELFGVIVTPATESGRNLLRMDSGSEIYDLMEPSIRSLSIENNIPGDKPIDHETAWGVPEKDLPETEPKNHFASKDEEVHVADSDECVH